MPRQHFFIDPTRLPAPLLLRARHLRHRSDDAEIWVALCQLLRASKNRADFDLLPPIGKSQNGMGRVIRMVINLCSPEFLRRASRVMTNPVQLRGSYSPPVDSGRTHLLLALLGTFLAGCADVAWKLCETKNTNDAVAGWRSVFGSRSRLKALRVASPLNKKGTLRKLRMP